MKCTAVRSSASDRQDSMAPQVVGWQRRAVQSTGLAGVEWGASGRIVGHRPAMEGLGMAGPAWPATQRIATQGIG